MTDLDRDLEAAIEADIQSNEPSMPKTFGAAPFTAGRAERLRIMKAADTPAANPAMAQLATAIQGLLKMEEELRQLARDLVGEIKDETDREVPTPPDGQPIIPRLRSDAELLARLAIRQHRLIQQIRELL